MTVEGTHTEASRRNPHARRGYRSGEGGDAG